MAVRAEANLDGRQGPASRQDLRDSHPPPSRRAMYLQRKFVSDTYTFERGTVPLLISIPHLGTMIPDAQRATMTDIGRQCEDADWHLDTLYSFARGMGASVLAARYSRYVVDLNRPPDDGNLYPGQTATGLFPRHTFRGEPLYLDDKPLDEAEKALRRKTYWEPYHAKLREELDRLKALHGGVLLWEAHSIASVLPRLFEGKLPDLNIGTAKGNACAPELLAAVEDSLRDCPYTWVSNGRFTGGYITRHFGAPAQNIHAIQLEMCQSTYMNESAPYNYLPDTASRIIPVVEAMMRAAFSRLEWRQT